MDGYSAYDPVVDGGGGVPQPPQIQQRPQLPYRQDIVPPELQMVYQRLHFSPAVRVGNTLHLSGQVGRDNNLQVVDIGDPPTEEGMERQFIQCFDNVQRILHSAGADFADVFQLETWFTDMPAQLRTFMKVKDRYFLGPTYPVWTGFGVSHFSTPGIICEVRVSAILRNFPAS
mmetsp:Transcript_7939/g.14387  ORF Transcript_7939/g.14387 Transcript_7939/m.14387 type:complete len:173 (+) Transcript_7939:23-541(+)